MRKVYLSVGSGLSPEQEKFVQALERKAEAAGLSTRTVGRTDFSSDAPLIAVRNLMDECDGAIVLALERLRFEAGVERPGSEKEAALTETRLATPWNQIEATLAYDRNLPLLVLVDEKLRKDGMLEPNNDWYVESLIVDPSSLDSKEFIGRFRHWVAKLEQKESERALDTSRPDIERMTISDWVRALTPAQAWGSIIAVATLVGAAFALGAMTN